MVALFLGNLNIAEIAGHSAAHAQNAGLLIQDVQQLIYIFALFVADELHNSRVDVAASGSHDQALQRGKAHTGVHALAADGSGHAGAVA